MKEKERMLSGKLYIAKDEELLKENLEARILTRKFNDSKPEEFNLRSKILAQLLEKTGDNYYIEPPFRCEYGRNITVGNNFYANFDCLFLDVNKIIIGNNVMLGPRVCLYTAGHPIDAEIRNSQLEYGKPIIIGNDVWIGGSVIINPGITIGNNVVIGSGSVVTKDIPSGVIAAGNPCRILRKINEKDKEYWETQKNEYYSI